MPLGMMYTVTHMASHGGIPPEEAIAAATGNNARVYRLNAGLVEAGKDADLVVLDAPLGGTQSTALDALRHGDIVAIGAVVSGGVPRFVGRSRNTPPPVRQIRVAECRIPASFDTARH
jgi:enamidase